MIATIILAAGESLRLKKEPKQLINYKGRSLLRRTIDAALLARRDDAPVIVVLGAYKDQIMPTLAGLPITIVDNLNWESGVASSIRTGLAALFLLDPKAEATFLLNTDQPHVSAGLLVHMVELLRKSKLGLVACRYNGNRNLPALFTRPYFETLLQLTGDRSPRWELVRYRADCAEVPFEAGAVDIDAPWDLASLYES